jgi:hypothetical protein
MLRVEIPCDRLGVVEDVDAAGGWVDELGLLEPQAAASSVSGRTNAAGALI